MVWLEFLVCAGLIVVAGHYLSQSADVLAEKLGWGRTWVGAVLLASITSLPELITGVSAIQLVGAPDLAVGSIFGSCLFNLLLLAVLDLVYQPGPALREAHEGHILSGGLGVLLIAIASMRVFVNQAWGELALGWIAPTSYLIALAYLVGMRLVYRFELRRMVNGLETRAEALLYNQVRLARALATFGVAAVSIVGLGVWLSFIGDEIARSTGLGASFVGNVFLAASTSLPEVVVTLSAARLKAVDLAVSNLLGSNLFNIAILSLYDAAYVQGSLWNAVTSVHTVAGLGAIAMTAVAVISLTYRASRRTALRLSWDGLLLIGMYLATLGLLFVAGRL